MNTTMENAAAPEAAGRKAPVAAAGSKASRAPHSRRQAAVASVEDRPAGRPRRLQEPAEIATLRQQVAQLERELQVAQVREEIALALPQVNRTLPEPDPSPAEAPKKNAGRDTNVGHGRAVAVAGQRGEPRVAFPLTFTARRAGRRPLARARASGPLARSVAYPGVVSRGSRAAARSPGQGTAVFATRHSQGSCGLLPLVA